jgi:hypothetical protein
MKCILANLTSGLVLFGVFVLLGGLTEWSIFHAIPLIAQVGVVLYVAYLGKHASHPANLKEYTHGYVPVGFLLAAMLYWHHDRWVLLGLIAGCSAYVIYWTAARKYLENPQSEMWDGMADISHSD